MIDLKSGDMEEIARGNPLFPEAHYPASKIINVEPGDTIITRCLFDSMNQSSPINTSENMFYRTYISYNINH